MIIELITPLLLATAPVMIEIPQGSYDHRAQITTYTGQGEGFGNMRTWSGTQTFAPNGRPMDSDND